MVFFQKERSEATSQVRGSTNERGRVTRIYVTQPIFRLDCEDTETPSTVHPKTMPAKAFLLRIPDYALCWPSWRVRISRSATSQSSFS
jgi:hypothetical protein